MAAETASLSSWGPTATGVRLSQSGWIILCLLCASLLGLNHSFSDVLGPRDDVSTEAGKGIEDEEKFAKDVSAAPISRQLGFLGVMAVAAFCALGTPRGVRIASYGGLLLMAALLGWTVASLSWSANRGETARELVRIVVYLAAGAMLARRLPIQETCAILMACLAVSVCLAAVLDVITPGFRPWSSGYRMQGTLHSNDLARQSLLLAVGAYAYARRLRGFNIWWLVLGAALLVLLLTKSRTALLTVMFGLAAVQFSGLALKSLFGSMLTATAAVAVVMLLASVLDTTTQRKVYNVATLGRGEEVTSLTGRLPLWKEVWKQAHHRAGSGFGYGAFWTVNRTQDMGKELKWYPRHAHSVYIETVVNLGYPGLTLLLMLTATLLFTALLAYQTTHWVEYQIFAAVIVSAMVNGISEAAFVLPRDQGLFNSILMFSLILMHPVPSRSTSPTPPTLPSASPDSSRPVCHV
jgi:exopolysaccharide production protein ExoQ